MTNRATAFASEPDRWNDLRQSDARFRALVEYGFDGVVVVDGSGLIQYASPAATRSLGYQTSELVGRHFESLMQDPDAGRRIFTRVLQQPQTPIHDRLWVRHKEGGFRLIEFIASNRIDEPSIRGVVGNFVDVTDRLAAERTLRDTEVKFAKVFENSPLAMSISDLDSGRILESNPAFSRLAGYAPEEVIGRTSAELQLWDDPSPRARVLTRLRGGEVITNLEAILKTRSGQRRRVLVSLDRLDLPGRGSPAYISVVVDITERHQLEEQFRQAQKMEAVGRLAGGVAHDFNNLLTAIIGYSELLISHRAIPPDAATDLQEILKAGHSAAALTRQLLAFSRRQALEPKVFNLNDTIVHVAGIVRRLVGEDIDIVTTLDRNLAPILADRGQVEQVILNLTVNARDAMPSGGVLTIETANVVLDESFIAQHRGAANGPHVMLSVSDTGIGMDDAVKSRLFEPFFTTKERGKGTGLGLATIYGIVKQSGGSIWVYSEPGLGSTFKIYLPATAAAAGSTAGSSQADAAPLTGSETILVVEDQEDVRSLVRQSLSRHGYDVLTAASPSEAQRIAESRRIDLLLTDVVMPGMSGRALARTLQRSAPHLRVLYMSGYADDAVLRHGLIEAGLDLLQKPFSIKTLAARVRQVLDTEPPNGGPAGVGPGSDRGQTPV